MRLHRRLTLTMAALLVIGLAVADVVTYSSLRSFLYGRIDAQLAGAQRLAAHYLYRTETRGERATAAGLDERIGESVYVMVLSSDGNLALARPAGSPFRTFPAPVLPRSVKLAVGTTPASGAYRPNPDDFNLASHGSVTYRAQAAAVPQGTLISAVPMTATDRTLASLIRVEAIASLGAIVVLCGLALWIVRRGLRPLDDMAKTAGAIASGDLTRRVEDVDEATEVGRLGSALNTMLSQIEAAFAEKSASEARLRQFVADASHELRTPLTSIRGYAELLRKGAFDDEVGRRRALGRVEHEAARMGGLVNDLLLLARLDQGRPLERGPVDLRRICVDAVDDARLAEPGRTVRLVAPEAVVVVGDRDRLAQVAHNLVRNAVGHTRGPVRVEVAVDRGMGVVQVVDRGPGLDASQLQRVFDRFYRGDAARTGAGTGLGLAIVQAIAQALGGRAWAESTPGEGSMFAVAIPLMSPSAPPAEPTAGVRSRPRPARA